MVKTLLKAVVKKQVKKKRAKKRKKKKRTECDCDKKKKKTRKGKTGKDECEPELKLVSVEFLDDLDIYKDQIGKAPKITWAQWQDTKEPYGEPEIHDRIGYISGDTLQIKAKFAIEDKPEDLKTGSIQGKGTTPEGKTFFFQDKKVKLSGDSVTTEEMSANGPLATKRTQFINPLIIEWSLQYQKEGSPKTKELGTSKHQVYVTLAKPINNIDKFLYLTLLDWATSVPGANTKPRAVKNTWSHFANPTGVDDLKTWDNRQLLYYGDGMSKCVDYESKADFFKVLELPTDRIASCEIFANLFISSLWVNGLTAECVQVYPSKILGYDDGEPIREIMLVNNWEETQTSFPERKGHRWAFQLNEETGSMMPPFPDNAPFTYGDLKSVDGIPGQNVKKPVEKAFTRHFIVKANGRYYDPSYGVIHESPEDFEKNVLFGYIMPDPYGVENDFLARKHKHAGEVIFDETNHSIFCGF